MNDERLPNKQPETAYNQCRCIEQDYQDLFDNANEILYVHDLKGRFLSVNKAGERIMGYRFEAAKNYTIFHVIPKEHWDLLKQRLMQKIQGNLHDACEMEVLDSNGERLVMEISTRLLKRDGQPYAIQGIARDITARRQIEAALFQSEQHLMGTIDFLPDATVVIDHKGRVIAWNRAIEKKTGIKARDMMGKGNYEYALPFYGKRRPILIDLVLSPDAIGRGEYLSMEAQQNHLSGESFCPGIGYNGAILYGTASPLYDASGNIVGAIESIRDITERKNTEQRLQDIIDFLPDATLVIDRDGRVITWNRAMESMTGIKAGDIVGKGNYEYAIPFYGKRQPILINKVCSSDFLKKENETLTALNGHVLSVEYFCPTIGPDGMVLYGKASPLYDVTGTIVGAIESIRDITERRKMEEALRRSEENFRKLAEIAPAMIFVMQGERIIYVNKSTERIIGYNQSEFLYQSPWFSVHPDHREYAIASLPALQQEGGIADRDLIKMLHKDGSLVWIDLSLASIEFSGQPCILGVGIDVTENKLAADEIQYLSYHDKLTGLYNRAYFEEILPSFQKTRHMPLSLIMGDLNGLKMINDAFGHLKGDQLLQKVAQVMQFCCRQQDVIARWGGDEFLILLPNTDENAATVIAERISKSCRYLEGFPVQVSIALGVATQKSIVGNFDEVSKDAEDRMYRTKLLESKSNRSSFMSSLEKTLRVRSHETQAHTQRLRRLVVEIAHSLQLPLSDIHNLTLLATLHDIGKIAIPNSILDKPGPLSEDEWETMKKHPEIGYRIALSSPELAVIAEAILTHHERWDGNGYPMRLKAEGIPLHARILAIADAYDVMVSGRPYQKALTRVDALKEIKRCAGSQFDPELAGLFVSQVESDFAPQELEAYCNQAENLLDMHG